MAKKKKMVRRDLQRLGLAADRGEPRFFKAALSNLLYTSPLSRPDLLGGRDDSYIVSGRGIESGERYIQSPTQVEHLFSTICRAADDPATYRLAD
jgi:hypothetical protein